MGGDTEASRRDGRPTAVIDIDGTLADTTHRAVDASRAAKSGSQAWFDVYFDKEKIARDTPIEGAAKSVAALASAHHIVYLSGRRQGLEAVTSHWLRTHGFPEGEVILRPTGLAVAEWKRKAVADLKARAADVKVCIGDNEHDLQACQIYEDATLVLVESNKPWELNVVEDDGSDGNGGDDLVEVYIAQNRLHDIGGAAYARAVAAHLRGGPPPAPHLKSVLEPARAERIEEDVATIVRRGRRDGDGHTHGTEEKCDACAQANSRGLLGNIAQDHGLDGWQKLHDDAMEARITIEECADKLMQKAMLKHDGDAIELIEEVQRLLKGG